MATSPVTPVAGVNTQVVTGNTPVIVTASAVAGIGGGFIQNPQDPADQGLTDPEPLYVDPVGAPLAGPGNGWGTTFVLLPGQVWTMIPGQTTPTRVNAASSGHRFSAIYWPNT